MKQIPREAIEAAARELERCRLSDPDVQLPMAHVIERMLIVATPAIVEAFADDVLRDLEKPRGT